MASMKPPHCVKNGTWSLAILAVIAIWTSVATETSLAEGPGKKAIMEK
jgi:hypothetical protein